MNNPYQPPRSAVADIAVPVENNSGDKNATQIPPGVKGWSWGGFLLSWVWAAFNRVWIGLLALVPYVGFLMAIYLGIKGRELAWKSKRWESFEHFDRVQRSWSKWAAIIIVGIVVLGILAGIAIPAYQDYVMRARAG